MPGPAGQGPPGQVTVESADFEIRCKDIVNQKVRQENGTLGYCDDRGVYQPMTNFTLKLLGFAYSKAYELKGQL